jgi:hypothetical protein
MSARHRQHKRKIAAAKQALAECEVDLVSYARVIADMKKRPLPPFSASQTFALMAVCRDATAHDRERLLGVVADLERTLIP